MKIQTYVMVLLSAILFVDILMYLAISGQQDKAGGTGAAGRILSVFTSSNKDASSRKAYIFEPNDRDSGGHGRERIGPGFYEYKYVDAPDGPIVFYKNRYRTYYIKHSLRGRVFRKYSSQVYQPPAAYDYRCAACGARGERDYFNPYFSDAERWQD